MLVGGALMRQLMCDGRNQTDLPVVVIDGADTGLLAQP